MKVKKSLFKYLPPEAEIDVRLKAAGGKVALAPDDFVTVCYLLAHDKDEDVRIKAGKSLAVLSNKVLFSALAYEIDAKVIAYLLKGRESDETVSCLAVYNPNIDDTTLNTLAATGSMAVVEVINNSPRLSGNDKLLEALKSNKNALVAQIAKAEEAHNAEPIVETGGFEPIPEELLDYSRDSEVARKEKEKEKEGTEEEEIESKNLFSAVQDMNVTQKIKLATKGNREARGLLIKDRNRIIIRCVLSNPKITDDEIVKIVNSKSASDEILREIARNDEWMKNYQIKKGIVTNPKTPFFISSKQIRFLQEKDIRVIAKSRNVPNNVSSAAVRALGTKKH